MRILLVHDVGQLQGGAEAVVWHTKQEMRNRGHDVQLLAGDSQPPDLRCVDRVFRSADHSVAGKLGTYLWNGSAREAVMSAVRDFRPDLVHFHTVTRLSVAGVLGASGVPSAMTFHDYGLLYPRMHRVLPREAFCGLGGGTCCPHHAGFARYYFELLRTGLHHRARNRIDCFIAPSTFVGETARELGYGPVVVLGNPILRTGPDVDAQAQERRGVLFVGRLEEEKGVAHLVRCFRSVADQVPGALLYVIGDGSRRNHLGRLVSLLDLQGTVQFVGSVPASDLSSWYERVQVVAVPSVWPEPFGLVGPEAMAFGTPVVGSGRGGMGDWLQHEHNGLVCCPTNERELSACLVRLLTDDALSARLGSNARNTARRFAPGPYFDALESLYSSLASPVRSRPLMTT